MRNSYGLDTDYFTKKLKLVLKGVDNCTPDEMARELARLSLTADNIAATVEFVRFNDACNYGS